MNTFKETGNVYTTAVDTVAVAVKNTLAAAKRAGSSAVGAVDQLSYGPKDVDRVV